MYSPYPGYPGFPTDSGYSGPGYAAFGAEGDPAAAEPVAVSPAPIANTITRVQLWTPDWLKQSVTIAIGVFGGLSLFRMFSHRVPKGTKAGAS